MTKVAVYTERTCCENATVGLDCVAYDEDFETVIHCGILRICRAAMVDIVSLENAFDCSTTSYVEYDVWHSRGRPLLDWKYATCNCCNWRMRQSMPKIRDVAPKERVTLIFKRLAICKYFRR
jgi:hypothetical protein